jgi:hypothetical protein
MPNISETSVNDINLSPACRVMIIFSFVRCKIFGPNQSIQQLLHRSGCPSVPAACSTRSSPGRQLDESAIEDLSTLIT